MPGNSSSFGANGAPGISVMHVDIFSEDPPKGDPPPPVHQIRDEKELTQHIQSTFGVGKATNPKSKEAEDDKKLDGEEEDTKEAHDRFSVYLVRNCTWATDFFLREGLSVIPEFTQAVRGELPRSAADPKLQMKYWRRPKIEEEEPPQSGLFPYEYCDQLFAFCAEYPWYRDAPSKPNTSQKLITLRQSGGSNIEVNRGRLSFWMHLPSPSSDSENESRHISGIIVIFDDQLLTPPDTLFRNLKPLAVHFYENYQAAYFIRYRSILMAMLYGVFIEYFHRLFEDLTAMSTQHLIYNKEHILQSTANEVIAFELWRTEVFFRNLDAWAADTTVGLANMFPAWHYFHEQVCLYGLLYDPPSAARLKPAYKQPAEKLSTVLSDLFAAGRKEIANELLPGTEKNMHLLHTIAILQESRHSAEQGASMRRLTWITFIFLPMMFVSSIFGMNVEPFNSYTSVKWFFVFAVPLVVVVLGAWWGFKKYGKPKWEKQRRKMKKLEYNA